MKFVALLRGINVGGKNVIKMAELKACFESIGLSDVTTFIQSGNVLFATNERSIAKITEKVEEGLSKCFDYNSRVVIVSHEQLKNAVKHAPSGFGRKPAKYRYDVVFLRKPLSPAEAMKSVTAKDTVLMKLSREPMFSIFLNSSRRQVKADSPGSSQSQPTRT